MFDGKTTGCVFSAANQVNGASPSVVTLSDHSRFKNDGVLTNVTWTQLPSGLWVMGFPGTNGVVNHTDTNGAMAPSTLTVMLWVKYNTLSAAAPNNNACLLGKKNTTYDQANGWLWYTEQASKGWWLRGSSGVGQLSTVGIIDINIWYHAVVTVTGTTVAFYKNGVAVGGGTGTITAITKNTDTLRIGELSNDYPSWFTGSLALPRIYNYALSADQISRIYEAEVRWFK